MFHRPCSLFCFFVDWESLDKCRDGRSRSALGKIAIFIALVRCSSEMWKRGGGKKKSTEKMDGLRVIKVWSFGVGGAVTEVSCEDVV